MSSALTIRPASRQSIKPLVSLYAESGCGKTYSALLLARGFVGPTGRICMVDTESGRGELYADVLSGGYDVARLDPPFSPQRYIEAMSSVEKAGYSLGILDSGSHEWEGEGGVLDLAAESEEKSGKPGLHIWRAPKLAHGLWVRALLRAPIPWIVCLRAKFKSRQVKHEGRTQIVKDETLSPLQAEDFLFECTAHGCIDAQHRFTLTKVNHPDLRNCFPKAAPITTEHGAALAKWCAAGGSPATAGSALPSPADSAAPAAAPKAKLSGPEKVTRWVQRCLEAGGGHESYAFEWAVEAGVLLDTEALADWPEDKLPKTKEEVEKILSEIRRKAGTDEPPIP